jgi:hypothetical protein
MVASCVEVVVAARAAQRMLMSQRPWWHWLLIALALVLTGGAAALLLLRRPSKKELEAERHAGRADVYTAQAEAAGEVADKASETARELARFRAEVERRTIAALQAAQERDDAHGDTKRAVEAAETVDQIVDAMRRKRDE